VQKLHNKDFQIAFKTGSDANKSKFAKECVQGELYVSDNFLYIAESSAGVNDSALSKYQGLLDNNYSLSFDGSNDYIKTSGFTLGAAYSFSIWFKLNTAPSNSTLLNSEHYYTAGYNNFVYRISNASTIQLWSYSGNADAQGITITVPTLSTGTWYSLVLTNTGLGSAQAYLNGNSVTTSGSTSRAFTDLQNAKGLIIGDNLTNNNSPFDGNIDEVAVFDLALSASDSASIHNNGAPASISSLSPVGWWRMGDNDGGTGTTITDQGSGGNNGTLVNGPTFSSDVPS
jgi:hypothetical protein